MATTFINPFTDFGFKKIFGEEASKPHLIDFLNALLPKEAQIADLSFKNLEQLPKLENDRKAIYDIYCQGVDGDYFIVELQTVKQNFFKDRTLYYATFPIQEQAKKGDWDYRLDAVYCIGVLGFTFDDTKANRHQVVHKVELKDQDNEVFYKKLTFLYLEMPNFNKPLEELETRLDQWLFFIKNLGDLQSIPELLKDQVFTNAFETAKMANLNPNEMLSYQQSLKIMRDNYATQKYAIETALAEGQEIGLAKGREIGLEEGREIGLEEGREIGLEEGEARGRLETKLEIAKNLKAAGLTLEQIASATGLSLEELKAL